MTHLTSSPPSRRPRCVDLFASTALPGRAIRISHVHWVTLMTCRALRLRGCPTLLPTAQCRMVPSGFVRSWTIPNIVLTELYHFSPKAYGLPPLKSTLDPHGYPYRPKTRYQVRWVPASWAALSAASNTAPRGARQVNFSNREYSPSCCLFKPLHFSKTQRYTFDTVDHRSITGSTTARQRSTVSSLSPTGAT
jgi:hypothetical protein